MQQQEPDDGTQCGTFRGAAWSFPYGPYCAAFADAATVVGLGSDTQHAPRSAAGEAGPKCQRKVSSKGAHQKVIPSMYLECAGQTCSIDFCTQMALAA